MADNNESVLSCFEHAESDELGVHERANQQLSQGNRTYCAGALNGDTPIGMAKGNRVNGSPEATLTALQTGGGSPFTNLRKGR